MLYFNQYDSPSLILDFPLEYSFPLDSGPVGRAFEESTLVFFKSIAWEPFAWNVDDPALEDVAVV